MAEEATTSAEGLTADDFGKLILRVAVGGLMLFHGIHKLTSGIEGIEGMVTGAGLPTALAYGVYVGEFVAPVLMILGLFTRIAAIVLSINMVTAIALAHTGDILRLVESSGAWGIELQMLYFLGALSVALLGPGRLAVWKTKGWLA